MDLIWAWTTPSLNPFFFFLCFWWWGLPSLNPITAYNDRTSDLSFMSLIRLYLLREFWMWLLLLPFRIISRLWNLIFWNPSGATNLFAWFWWRSLILWKTSYMVQIQSIGWMQWMNSSWYFLTYTLYLFYHIFSVVRSSLPLCPWFFADILLLCQSIPLCCNLSLSHISLIHFAFDIRRSHPT